MESMLCICDVTVASWQNDGASVQDFSNLSPCSRHRVMSSVWLAPTQRKCEG